MIYHAATMKTTMCMAMSMRMMCAADFSVLSAHCPD